MRVKELMKGPVVTVGEEAPLSSAMKLMARHRVRHLPVVREGMLVGILTDRDCRKAWASSAATLKRYEMEDLLERLLVKEVMTRGVVTVTPETSALEAARLIHERKIGCLPVMEGHEVVGMVTTTDLLASLAELVEERFPMTPHRIIVPTDLSRLSAQAVEHARALAEEYGAELIVLNVTTPPNVNTAEGPVPEELLDWLRIAREEEALVRLRKAFPDGTRTRYRVVTGYPELEIARVARAEGVDLIVMATHARKGLSAFLAGSVTEEVLRRAPCPVLALRG